MREYSFPYVVSSPADLPDSFQQPVEQFLKPNDPANLILVIPRHSQTRIKRQHFVPPQALLFTTSGLLHVQDGTSPAQPPSATFLRGADLLYAEHTLILLYGRLELGGAIGGQLARIAVEYNTVRQDLLQPSLQQFLSLAYGPRPAEPYSGDLTEALLARLDTQSHKFNAGLRLYALQPDEHLLGSVHQPRIVQRIGFLFGRPMAPATLLALTDRAVLLIEEDKPRGASYGWRITCCPRTCVASIETQPKSEWRDVYVRLARNNVAVDRRVTLDNATALAWEALWLNGAISRIDQHSVLDPEGNY